MNIVTVIMALFSIIAGFDRIIGNKMGLGKEFDKGFMLIGNMMLSMTGMIIISPFIADLLEPLFDAIYSGLHIDPSIIPASLFANDMGGAPLAAEVAKNESIGLFNALVVSSMLGCTISFTIPYALGAVDEENRKELLVGLLCGMVTIPIGCFVAGLMVGLPVIVILIDLAIPFVLSMIIAVGLLLAPNVCVKIFSGFGFFMKAIITVGLVVGGIGFLFDFPGMVASENETVRAIGNFMMPFENFLSGLETMENAAMVCVNASIVMSGAFPLVHIISKLISKPLKKLGGAMGINETSAMGFVSSLATSVTTYEMTKKMDKKGIVLNCAFTVSGAFVAAGHLAFTLAFDQRYIFPMIAGKLISGITAVVVAVFIYKRIYEKENA
ncbi:MAG: ethanolamine utilization protein EutH [Ruminococcaceae bacterium]|nr:ethanolamine utilization protein EutH [Oscillospiraceae bacterium]